MRPRVPEASAELADAGRRRRAAAAQPRRPEAARRRRGDRLGARRDAARAREPRRGRRRRDPRVGAEVPRGPRRRPGRGPRLGRGSGSGAASDRLARPHRSAVARSGVRPPAARGRRARHPRAQRPASPTAVALADPPTLDELYWLGRVTLLDGPRPDRGLRPVFGQVFRGIIDMADFRGDSSEPAPPSSTPTGERKPGDPQRSEESPSTSPRARAPPRVRGRGRRGGRGHERPGRRQRRGAAGRQGLRRLHARRSSRSSAGWSSSCRSCRRCARARRLRRHSGGSSARRPRHAAARSSHRRRPGRLVQRKRTERPRRVVLIADVSGSMEPYARVYLHLMRGAVQALHAEAFVFATRLTRLTRALRRPRTPTSPTARPRPPPRTGPAAPGSGARWTDFLD